MVVKPGTTGLPCSTAPSASNLFPVAPGIIWPATDFTAPSTFCVTGTLTGVATGMDPTEGRAVLVVGTATLLAVVVLRGVGCWKVIDF